MEDEDLSSMLRHDLRNKFQICSGYTELLEDTELSEEQKEYVEKLGKSLESGADLIETVRTMRKLDGEERELEPVRLHSYLENTIEDYKPEGMEIELAADGKEDEISVKGDPLLEELFRNLIENSIKHSGGSKIKVSYEDINEEVEVTVEDDGKGIPNGKKDKVFEKGWKGEGGETGLGLYLVNEIAEEYDGNVEVKDSELGGARFVVCLQKADYE